MADAANEIQKTPTGCPISAKAAGFDVFGERYRADPADLLSWSRDKEPVFYSPKLGYWIVTRYEDVKAVFRDNILFSPSVALEKITPAPPEAEEILKSYGYAMNRTLVNEDEPAHMERRRVLMDSFDPEKLEKHQPAVRKMTRQYMDKFINKGQADLVAEMFKEIPLVVALEFLGVPEEESAKIRKFSVAHTVNTWGRPTPEEQLEVAHSVGKFWQIAVAIIEKMKESPDGDGWMYFTVRQHLKYPEIVTASYLNSMMMAILVAAHETTAHATSNMFRVLLSDREKWQEICDNPKLIPNAVEECLRYEGSVVAWRRRATEETEIAGVKIPKDARLLIVTASANHDERHFENPDEIDLYRDNTTEHMTFGYGSHQCMGKNIGRMQMRIFLEEFTRRLPHLHINPEQKFSYLPNTSFRGPAELWVTWDPAKNPEITNPVILDCFQEYKIGPPVKDELFRRVRVSEIKYEANNIIRMSIVHPAGKPLPKWSAGAHIDMISGEFNRKYSLCGNTTDGNSYQIAILKEEDGRGGSIHFHENLKPGDSLQIIGPKNHFNLDEKADEYILIAGGIGITPIIALADRLKEIGKQYHIHYAGKSRSSMAFANRLKEVHKDCLTLYVKDEGKRMRLPAVTKNLDQNTKVYACGPERLLDELISLSENWNDGALNYEHFTSKVSVLNSDDEHAFDVILKDSDVTVNVRADQTILEALLAKGIDVPYDCQEGICGTCEVGVLKGPIDHRDQVLTKTERGQGDRMMACCSRAKGNSLMLVL